MPTSVLAALRTKLTYYANGSGEAHPGDEEYLVTTRAAADKVIYHTTAGHVDPNAAVYVLVARGTFRQHLFPTPAGAKPAQLSCLVVEIDAKTLSLNALGLRRDRPDLEELGPLLRLP